MTTVEGWQQTSPDTLEVWQKSLRLKVPVEASGAHTVTGETIEDDGLKFQRIALRLSAPTTAGWIRVRFTP